MRFFISLLAAAACLCACHKSDLQNTHIGLYRSKRLSITTAPKMYTQNGEIVDRTAVDRYLNALSVGNRYFFRNTDTIIFPNSDTIQFIAADTALIKQLNRWDKRVVRPQGEYSYLYPLDTLRTLGNPNTSPFAEVILQIGVYKPYIKTTCFGYSSFCTISSYEAAIVEWQSGKLVFPLMSYSLIHSEPNGTLYGSGRSDYNNLFDPSVTMLLKNRDTLLVQGFELAFEKVQ